MISYKGIDYETVTRSCACGCDKTFKCFPGSKQQYFSRFHDPEYGDPVNRKAYLKTKTRNFNAWLSRRRKFEKAFGTSKDKHIYVPSTDYFLEGKVTVNE